MVGAAVTSQATEADVDPAVAEGQSGPLLDVQRVLLAGWGVDVDGHPLGARVGVETDQLVVNDEWCIFDLGDDEDLACVDVGDRGAGDSERVDVSAAGLGHHARERRSGIEVPQDVAVMGVETVHAVVLGGGDDPAVKDERLAVDSPIERSRPRWLHG